MPSFNRTAELMSTEFVCIPDCIVVQDTMRALLIECPHFPAARDGSRRLHVHKALVSPQHYVPLEQPGPLVVMKRFTLHYKITATTVIPDPITPEEPEQDAS